MKASQLYIRFILLATLVSCGGDDDDDLVITTGGRFVNAEIIQFSANADGSSYSFDPEVSFVEWFQNGPVRFTTFDGIREIGIDVELDSVGEYVFGPDNVNSKGFYLPDDVAPLFATTDAGGSGKIIITKNDFPMQQSCEIH